MATIIIYQANVQLLDTNQNIVHYFLIQEEVLEYMNTHYPNKNKIINVVPYVTTEGSTEHRDAISLSESSNP